MLLSTSDNKRYLTRIENECVSKNFNDIIRLIRSNFSDKKLQRKIEQINYNTEGIDYTFLSEEIISVHALCEWILNIKEFFREICIICNGYAYTNNYRHKCWMLDTNIILDANGVLQSSYELDPKLYHLKGCENVLEHKNWNISIIPINTTSAGKGCMEQYYEFIKDHLKKYDQDILVVCKKEEVALLSDDFQQIGYFGNIIGSNQWADIKNIAIIHTPNLNDFEYMLTYLYYNHEDIENNINLSARRRGRKMVTQYMFNDPRFEKIRTKWIAAEIYQAIKRVNRNMAYDTECVIFINNDNVVELLQSKLKGCTIHRSMVSDSDVGYISSKGDKYIETLIDNSHASKFIHLMAELQEGRHADLSYENRAFKKKVIRIYLGITSPSAFNNHVLNKSSVIEYCAARNIIITGQTIKLTG